MIKIFIMNQYSNNMTNISRKIFSAVLFTSIISFASCTEEVMVEQDCGMPLQVSVNANGPRNSRTILHGEWLPSGSTIGVSLFNTTDNKDYEEKNYQNIKFTATGEEEDQTWAGSKTVTLSDNQANLVAYYPWMSDIEDLSVIPVETESQTDYMYSTLMTGFSNSNAKANITMQHALTAIRVQLILGDYSTTQNVSAIAVTSSALGSSATLNAFDGSLADVAGQGETYTVSKAFAITEAGEDTDILFVPDANVTSGKTGVSVFINGEEYYAEIPFDKAYQQGYIYTYILKYDLTGLSVVKVKVTPWNEGKDKVATFEPGLDDAYIVKIKASSQYATGGKIKFDHNVVGFIGSIVWGDGTTTTYNEPVDFPMHTYPNDGKEYTIKAEGTINALTNGGENDNFGNCLREVVYIGKDCGVTSMQMAFYDCGYLKAIPEGLFDKCPEVTSFGATFNSCTSLQSIPEGLFDKCTKVTSFAGTFAGCSSLTEIPEGLFDNCPEVTDFSYFVHNNYSIGGGGVFANTNITIIPEGMFDHNTKVTNFGRSFYSCENLQTIPEGLFDHCTEVTDFSSTFEYCPNLLEIPIGLFDYNTKVTDFRGTFSGCKKLQAIPAELFDNCPEVTEFTNTFLNCQTITEIPEGLFDNNTKVTSFSWTFGQCTNLIKVPNKLFINCTELKGFYSTFNECKSLITIPGDIFDGCTKVTTFEAVFQSCIKLQEIPEGLFKNNTEVLQFRFLFRNCNSLIKIPENLFSSCEKATNFQQTFSNCTSLPSVPSGLFDKCTKINDVYRTFEYCSNLRGESPYTIVNGSKVHLYQRKNYPDNFETNIYYTFCFAGCTGMSDYSSLPYGWYD